MRIRQLQIQKFPSKQRRPLFFLQKISYFRLSRLSQPSRQNVSSSSETQKCPIRIVPLQNSSPCERDIRTRRVSRAELQANKGTEGKRPCISYSVVFCFLHVCLYFCIPLASTFPYLVAFCQSSSILPPWESIMQPKTQVQEKHIV